MHRFARILLLLCLLPLRAPGATSDRSAQARLTMQRLACTQALADLGEGSVLEAALVEGGRLLADHEPIAPLLDAILFAEDGFQWKPHEAIAFRNWRTFHGPSRERAIQTATPFWVRNAVAFIAKADCWSGVQKAVVFHALASRIVALNTLRDLDRGPMWSFRVFRTRDRAFVFHGPRHRLFIADRIAPGALVRSERMNENMLQREVWPHETAGSLEGYYRTVAAFPTPYPNPASPMAADYSVSSLFLLLSKEERGPAYISLDDIWRAVSEAERVRREAEQERLQALFTPEVLSRFLALVMQEPVDDRAREVLASRLPSQWTAPAPPPEPPPPKTWSRFLLDLARDVLLGRFWRGR